MKWLSWDDLRRRASRKPTALLLRPRRRELRFEILDDRRMLSTLLPAFGPSIDGNPGEEGIAAVAYNAETPVGDAATVGNRTNPLIAVLDDTLLEIEGRVQQIQTLIDDVIHDGSLTSAQIFAAQLHIDSLLETIDRTTRNTRYQGVPLFMGLLDSSEGGLLLDVGHHNSLTDPNRIYIPCISTATLGGVAGWLFQLQSGGENSLDDDAAGGLEVTNQTLDMLHDLRVDYAQFISYFGADVILIPDRISGSYRLTEIQSDSPVCITNLSEAESVLFSPDETFVCLSGFQDGSTAVFRWDQTSEILSFLELLYINESQRENPLLVEAANRTAEIQSVLNELATVASTITDADDPSDEFLSEQQTLIDQLLDTIDTIAETTSYNGKLLLDGSLDISVANVDDLLIHDLKIYQAAFINSDPLDVHVNIVEPATRAELFYEGGVLQQDIVLELGGVLGYEACNFSSGTTIVEIAAAINLEMSEIGVEAVVENGGTKLVFRSVGFGHDKFVSVKPLEGSFAVADCNGVYSRRQYGSSANVEINGIPAMADGFDVTLSTAPLDLRFTLDAAATAATESTFQVSDDAIRYLDGTEGGLQQYTRLGIQSLASDDLGGMGGRLSDLHSTQGTLLDQDAEAALPIIEQAANEVKQLFVRLDVLAQGESAVSVVIPSGPGVSTTINAVPEANCSKRVTPLLAAADNGLASITVMLRAIQDLVSGTQDIELKQLKIDLLLQAIQRTATTSMAASIAPLDGSFQLTTSEQPAGRLHNVEVNHVDFDGLNPFSVDVEVIEQATKGRLTYEEDSVAEDVVLEFRGASGFVAFHFAAGSTIGEVASAINLVSDYIGVRAEVSSTVDALDLIATEYGSGSFVKITAIRGTFPTIDSSGAESTRSEGTDANVQINGIPTVANGLRVALNHPQLGFSCVLDETLASGSNTHFVIPLGGVQLEASSGVPADSVPTLGILDARPVELDGASGTLDELQFNGGRSLLVDPEGALLIANEAISSVIRERGRLAIFERDILGIAWPQAANDNYDLDQGSTLTVDSPGVLANDITKTDLLWATLNEWPSHGTVILGSDGSFSYSPHPDFFGIDTFTYKANDGSTQSDTATVTITVKSSYDLDNDGKVGLGDLAFFASVYREKPGITTESPYAAAADFDRSGTVDLGDLALFAANYQLSRSDDSLKCPVKVSQSSSSAPSTALFVAATPTLLSSDAKHDGTINDDDTNTLALNWQKQTTVIWPNGDFNADGLVDDIDAAILTQHWMMTVEKIKGNDDAHEIVFAAIAATDDALRLYDE